MKNKSIIKMANVEVSYLSAYGALPPTPPSQLRCSLWRCGGGPANARWLAADSAEHSASRDRAWPISLGPEVNEIY